MKVLIWVGHPVGKYDTSDQFRLAKVWVDEHQSVHVDALKPEFEPFARQAQAEIDARIADPRGVFYHRTGWVENEDTPDMISVTSQQRAEPGDDNFLEVLRGDVELTRGGLGRDIGGYEIWSGASIIYEE